MGVGLVGEQGPVAVLHVVLAEVLHEFECLVHLLDILFGLCEDLVIALLLVQLLDVAVEGGAFLAHVAEGDLLPVDVHPIVEEQPHL